VAETVAAVRAANTGAIYCCDPVMGDVEEGLYVEDSLPGLFREVLVPAATIVTPNAFELELLTGRPTRTEDEVLGAARALLERGPRLVVATSLCFCADRAGCTTIETLAVSEDAAWRLVTPRLPLRAKGSGDVLAALFLAHTLRGAAAPEALANACGALFEVIEETVAADAEELLLIAAQDRLAGTARRFEATPLA
jgi:pyridoxine kinase